MSWYTVSTEGITASVTGWHTGVLGKLIFFIGLAVLALLILRATGFELPPNVPLGMVIACLGAVATVFVLVRLISIPTTSSAQVEASGSGSACWRRSC